MSTPWQRRDVLKGLAAGAAWAGLGYSGGGPAAEAGTAALILRNARITTLDPSKPDASAVAMAGGRIIAVGDDRETMVRAAPGTTVIDAGRRRVIPGLIDSHTHLIRGGLNYNMELRWDGVPSLSEAMGMLRRQVRQTPPPQWVRVVGGFTEQQFAEKRLPTLAELNEVAPETPVFILRLYDRALLNRAALRAVGYTKDTPDPPGGVLERNRHGEPTGLLLAKPDAALLYATLGRGPRLSLDDQLNSTRHFMRELNRLGVTSVIDAGGGNQKYPEDYEVIERLARADQLTVRIAYNLFTQKPKEELADFRRWSKLVQPGQGSDFYRHNGAGEMLVYSAADFENFVEPRPDLPPSMENELAPVVRFLAEAGWPFRLHATYDETIDRALGVIEAVNREVPVTRLHWFIDHAETISPANIERVKALGGGIAVQHRMAFQGREFAARYGAAMTADAPPLRRILAAGVPLGAGTDATRVASYNPWVSLHWLVTGQTIDGMTMYPPQNRLPRDEALRSWTEANTWFSRESGRKGAIKAGYFADLAVLSGDYMTIPEGEIKDLQALLTVVGGRIAHADGPYRRHAPPLPLASPDWSPVLASGGHFNPGPYHAGHSHVVACGCWMG